MTLPWPFLSLPATMMPVSSASSPDVMAGSMATTTRIISGAERSRLASIEPCDHSALQHGKGDADRHQRMWGSGPAVEDRDDSEGDGHCLVGKPVRRSYCAQKRRHPFGTAQAIDPCASKTWPGRR